ncbi:MAG TPA: FkbM family methyltransferase [bacterium]|nr:FkbM family methyltransferase [bacterium]
MNFKHYIKRIKDFYTISDNFGYFLNFIFMHFYFYLKRRFSFMPNFKIKLKCKKIIDNKLNKFFVYITDNSDSSVLNEIFVQDEYNFDINRNPRIIFDIGANVGFSTIYFKLKYPNSKIYSFEPDKNTFDKLLKNTSQFQDIICVNAAISNVTGFEKFYPYPGSSMSSSLIKRINEQDSIIVKSYSIVDFLNENKIDFVDLIKFDVEGSEFKIFQSNEILNKIGNLFGEVHLDIMGKKLDDFLNLFNNYSSYVKEISKERRYIVHLYNNKIKNL